ncbi:MAG: DEAD/DEAH box helicase [Anaerovoracaceae bacterium]|jgi:SNF2 family DNA or RNA helicase
MKFTPHEYQKYAIQYIIDHPVAAVLLDMGLGKTAVTLMAVWQLIYDRFEVHKVLVTAPLRVARDTWPAEIEKWKDSLPGLTFSVAVGSEKERLAALNKPADIHIISRDNLAWLAEKSGLPADYDMIVIDELSSFKNRQSKRWKAMMRLRTNPSVRRVVALSGSPAPNSYLELWPEYRLLDLGERLGRYLSRYRFQYFRPDRYNGPVVYSYALLPGAAEQIQNRIADITVSMKSTDYLKMPEKIVNNVTVRLDAKERKIYDTMKKELVVSLNGKEIDAANAASLSNKLMQMSSGAVYDDEGGYVKIHDRKIDALEDMVESMNGRPLLIFYWFRHELERIRERFPEARELKSHEDITAWNDGQIPLALLHPMSGGHGLNLQAGGNTCVWMTTPYSEELYAQSCARLWRQGQKSETVVIYHIVTENSIDQNVLKILRNKDRTQSALIDAVKANL